MSKFKKGDKVRFIGDDIYYVENAPNKGEEFIITDEVVGHSEITLKCPIFIDDSEFELVERIDPKTAFLSELKDLLARYGAELGDGGTYKVAGMEVTFDNGERIRYKHSTINADNIMDYEEE